jgi:hypothetical protein
VIFYWLVDFFATSLMPTITAMIPVCACGALADQVASSTRVVTGQAADLGAWVPWSLIGQLALFTVCVLGCAITIRCIRMVISHITGGGGSAA